MGFARNREVVWEFVSDVEDVPLFEFFEIALDVTSSENGEGLVLGLGRYAVEFGCYFLNYIVSP